MNKEWKGNSASVRTMLGMSTVWHPEQRAAGDFYTTDPAAVEALLRSGCVATRYNTVWEPACGNGRISEVLNKYFDTVVSTDLYDRDYGTSGIDFLETKSMPDRCDIIITNPPYSLADEFVKHAMDILPYGGTYWALMNLSYLAGKKRKTEIYDHRYLRKVLIFSGRINCYKNDIQTGHSSPVNYAWFCFVKNNCLPAQIRWI